MFNRTTVAKAFVMAACTLAIALLAIGMGVNATWAGSDPPFVRNFTPLSTAGQRIAQANQCAPSCKKPCKQGLACECCGDNQTCKSGTCE
jgi:hypothetical protein